MIKYVRDRYEVTTDGHLPGDDGHTLCRSEIGRAITGTRWQPVQPCPICVRVLREGTSRQRTRIGHAG